MNLTEKANCGKLRQGFFNRKSTQKGSKPFMSLATGRTASNSKKNSTPSSNLNWGRSRQSISSSGLHSEASVCNEDSRIVLALSEGRGEARCEVGIAVINVSQPHLILCQISDTQSYDNTLRKINIFNPNQILVPMTFVGSANQSRLVEKVKEQFPQVTHIPVRRNTYNKTSGMEFIQELCVSSLNSVLLVLQYRYYALAAASALFRFLQNNLNIFYASGSIKIEYQESEGYAVIDVSTADRLELVSSTKPLQASKYSTLFGVLNNCYTRIGERALRTILLQPPFATSLILERQECVAALMRHPEKLQSIQVILQKLGNVDQLLTLPTIVIDDSPTCSNRQLNYILYLNGLVDLIITLNDGISTFNQLLFENISVTLRSQDFLNIRDTVRTLIHENAYAAKSHSGLLQRCFAIKPGLNGLLDLVRKIYSERLDDMREYVKTLGEKYDLPLTLGNNVTKGYHIVFSLNKHQRLTMKKSDIPKEFIQVCRLAGSFTMKTMELLNFQTRVDDIVADILKISNVMIFKTLTSFKKHMGLFYRLCEDIAIIDVLQSLAEVSIRNNYVKPTFSDYTEVKESQHPMLDMLVHEKPVPNLISSCQNFNVHIITGPNGSGKSIYIRQVMLLQIMAQIGGYVPASSAVFRPADRLFARVYLEDNMECGASSFVLEMKEILYILSHITDCSLVIIDELARSTSLEEGAALAMAICECFVNSSTFVYLTSHFALVTKLSDLYLNVKNWFMDTDASGDTPQSLKLSFKHTIKNGVTNLKRYGIFMVKNIWPADLLDDVYSLLEDDNKTKKELKTYQLSRESRLKYNLEADLQKCNAKEKLTTSKINQLINHYQTSFENLNLGVGDSNLEIEEPGAVFFDDTVPDDVLSEAVDQVECCFLSSQTDSSYKRLSHFIAENSGNIDLLNPEIQIHEDGMKFVGRSSNQRSDFNPNIKILSNILLNTNNNAQDGHVRNNFDYNDELQQYSNLRSISQEPYQNSQDFEEVNEINRSLLAEMHNIEKENYEELTSENLCEGTLMEPTFIDSIENNYNQEQNTGAQTIIPTEQHPFNSFLKAENEGPDFCFLKPPEPPLRKRFDFECHHPMGGNNKENLNETDQISFSLGLLQNQDKSSTPIISRNRYTFKDPKMIFMNSFESKMDSSNFPSENTFSGENSQSSFIESEQRDGIFSIDNKLNDKEENEQKYFIMTNDENKKIETSGSFKENCQKGGKFSVNEKHIFPEVKIVQGPNNKSLSFGEEDGLLEMSKQKRFNKIPLEKDVNFERFVIEETKMFLSDSADIFNGDIDELEITVKNNENHNKSHREVAGNVSCLLKTEEILSKQQERYCNQIEEIDIQDLQSKISNKVDDDSSNLPIEPETGKYKEVEKKNFNSMSVQENPNPANNHSFAENIPNKNFKLPHNLFEESDLENYLNNNLTISKEQFQKVNSSTHSPVTHTIINNELPKSSTFDEKKSSGEQNSSKLMDREYTKSSSKNTVSISLSEASRRRNLDNTSSATTTSDNHEINGEDKKKLENSQVNEGVNDCKNTPKSSDYNDKTIKAPEMLIDKNNDSNTSSSRGHVINSLSDASRKRNLDNPASTSSSDVRGIFMECEKQDSDASSFNEKLNELIMPEANRNCDQVLMTECVPKYSDNHQKNPEDNNESRERGESNTSAGYEKAVETYRDLSYISKRRNLDNSPSKKSDSDNYEIDDCQKREHKKLKIEGIISKTCTGVSKCSTETLSGISSIHFDSPSTSGKMNADGSNSTLRNADSVSRIGEQVNDDDVHGAPTSESRPAKKRKYLGYRRSQKASPKKTKIEEPKKSKSLFRPLKLTKYQIQEEFDKQDRIILDENLDIETYNKYLIQRMNRPSIKQIQNMEHIVTFRKTGNGTIILPPPKKTTHKPRKGMTRKVFESSKLIDVSIFSDQNASKMSAFLASNERNYNQFKFEPDLRREVGFGDDSLSRSINFCSQFVQRRKRIITFDRSRSFGEFKFQDCPRINQIENTSFKLVAGGQSQQSDSSSIFLPHGYLKENKKDIDDICSKYLLGSQHGLCRTKTSPL